MPDPGRRLWRMVKCSGAALGTLVVAAVAGIYLWLNRSLPTPHANAVPGRCETIIAPGWERTAGRARAQAQELFVERDLPGLGVAFAIDGHVVWADAFGWADIERSAPACPSTTFRLASVSKTFTAVAAARLVEQGRLEWDAPVQRYVPSFKLDPRITPRLLAAHLAGIRDYRNDREARFTTPFHSATESVSLFASDPLIDTPGRAFHYSTYGYTLLGAAIEGAAGASFPKALRDLLLQPLGLQGIWADSARHTPRLTTQFYERHEQSGWVATPAENLSGKWAGGGLLGNAPDIARFGSTLTRQNFLRPRTLEELWTPYSHEGPIGYGLGWMIARDTRLRRVRFHFGADDAGTAFLAVWPDRSASLAVLTNRGHARFPFRRLVSLANALLETPN